MASTAVVHPAIATNSNLLSDPTGVCWVIVALAVTCMVLNFWVCMLFGVPSDVVWVGSTTWLIVLLVIVVGMTSLTASITVGLLALVGMVSSIFTVKLLAVMGVASGILLVWILALGVTSLIVDCKAGWLEVLSVASEIGCVVSTVVGVETLALIGVVDKIISSVSTTEGGLYYNKLWQPVQYGLYCPDRGWGSRDCIIHYSTWLY